MAVKVEARKELVTQALEQLAASLKRQKNTSKNPLFLPIIEKDLAEVNNAITSIAETK